MIVPMVRALAACRQEDRDALLRRLRSLGALHIVPIGGDPVPSGPDSRDEHVRGLDAALRLLRPIQPEGPRPAITGAEAAAEVLAISQRADSARARMDALHREAERIRIWGDVRVAQLRSLADAGLELHVLIVPEAEVSSLRGRVVHPLQALGHRRRLVALVGPAESLPESVEELPPPTRDRDAIRAEAATNERSLAADRTRLAALAWHRESIEEERERRLDENRWESVIRSGLADGALFGLQGWIPEDRAAALPPALTTDGLAVAVRIAAPAPDDRPPTLIRYRRWARPVDALFRALNMVPGYDEVDASSVFMVAIPAFAGMIIGDAGYGLLFIAAALLAGRRLARKLGPEVPVLIGVFGLAALAWGALTGVWFGLTPAQLMAHGDGAVAAVGSVLDRLQRVRGTEQEMRTLLIEICFVIGASHLIVAHVRRALDYAPDPRALAEIGWCVVLTGMLGVIWILFFGSDSVPGWLGTGSVIELGAGVGLVAWFSAPNPSIGKRLGLGLAGSLLPFLGTFSDTLSYIRLMAVGLASYYLGATFNLLAASLAESTSWIFGGLVLVGGHGLNIALIAIAIFAHGVRLNVLEFSSNAGIHWTGHPYRPFSDRLVKDQQ